MPDRPLLTLPRPEQIDPPKGHGGGANLRIPTKDSQLRRFQPVFTRLRRALDAGAAGAMELRDDPTTLAPDRVIVFEIAGTVADFVKAVSRVPGLEFMVEYDTEEAPDERFAEKDARKDKAGEDRKDKAVPGRFYLAMPDVAALRQLLSLWGRWQRGEELGRGFAPFRHVFSQLRTLRPWGPEDRISDETIAYWREEMAREPGRPVRTEVELWFHSSQNRRNQSARTLAEAVAAANGRVVHEVQIPEIAYHGALIDIPADAIRALIERGDVRLALVDDVMFLRPQSQLLGPVEPEPLEDRALRRRVRTFVSDRPIAALLDGVPLQGHALLANRLVLDDPDNLQNQAIVTRRLHGTAMASLIIHGDLNAAEAPLSRPLYVRPLMYAPVNGPEVTVSDRLVVDTLYRAVLRIRGSEGEEAVAPTVFLVNLSMGDPRRPFSRLISPLARLLDFLSDRYGILFLVSAGNVTTRFEVPGFNTWTSFETAPATDRERAVLEALNGLKHERTLLSPAEAINALTVGAQHHDSVANRPMVPGAVDPFDDHELPNASSALGLGPRRMVKPDIYLPGGREHLRMAQAGGGVAVRFGSPQRLYGLRAAVPDTSGQGRLGESALSDGTSSATALATRAAHRIFDALMDRDGGSLLADTPPEFYAVMVKTLLVHSARWGGKSDLLADVFGPADGHRHIERAENVARFLGFGVPSVIEAMECSASRATLAGFGTLEPDHADAYRIPLPGCLERVTDPRSLTVTLAWLSPVKSGHQSYRCVRLEAAPQEPMVALGVKRSSGQPADPSVKRGTVFHEHYSGKKAVPFIDDGHLALQVWCKDDAGGIDQGIRYGLAITIEAGTPISVYDQIRDRMRAVARVTP